MNIVVVENDFPWLKSLELVLKNLGHTIHAFEDPLQAMYFINSKGDKIEILIVDFLMPAMDGLTLLERTRGKLGAGCRVIMISGHEETLKQMALESYGISAFLPKPIDLDRLQELVEAGPVHS